MEIFSRHVLLHYTEDPQRVPTAPHDFSTGPFYRDLNPELLDASSASPIYTFGIYSRRIGALVDSYKAMSVCLRCRPPANWKSAPRQRIQRWREVRLEWIDNVEGWEFQLEVASRGVVLSFFSSETPQEMAEEKAAFLARIPPLEDSAGWSVRHEGLFILKLMDEVEAYKGRCIFSRGLHGPMC